MFAPLFGILIGGVLITIARLGFFGSLPYPFSAVDIALVAALFIIFFGRFNTALIFSVWLGCLGELYTTGLFGAYFISLVATVIAGAWLINFVVTNRSWHALLLLVALGTLLFDIIHTLASVLGGASFSWADLPLVFAWEIALNIGLAGVIYLIFKRFARGLRKIFIVR